MSTTVFWTVTSVLALSLVVTIVGIVVGLGARINDTNAALRQLDAQQMTTRTLLDETIMEVVMNSTELREIVQETIVTQGTFDFSYQTDISATETRSSIPFTYKSVRVESLLFTVLQLDPPTTPITTPAGTISYHLLRFNNFNPTLPITFQQSGQIATFLPVSPSNVNRFNMPCIANTMSPCYLLPELGATPRYFSNQFRWTSSPQISPDISFYLSPGQPGDSGFEFTWFEPLQLVIPST